MRLNHVILAVSDLERSVAFYGSLGLNQIVADEGYNVDTTAAELKAKGIELDQDPVDQPYRRAPQNLR